ncbi:hypothetical protein BDV30DRAFT_213370 [Aspergillus minisclerotigenes]|uniref:Uncharacterized protein n=1 Tax=Aspergillus minisclerotigenes TaxID=656917 RepID=A0A5N6IYG1_9EURO|nr:hypothetical protein BDV30DRAFT_213370 [Aspergillus minisclerotigenes]
MVCTYPICHMTLIYSGICSLELFAWFTWGSPHRPGRCVLDFDVYQRTSELCTIIRVVDHINRLFSDVARLTCLADESGWFKGTFEADPEHGVCHLGDLLLRL